MNKSVNEFITDILTVETYENGIERILQKNRDISYDTKRDELVLKKDNTVYTYPAKVLYENDFFTGGIFEEEPDFEKLTCAVDNSIVDDEDTIIEKIEKGYSIFEFHKKDVPGYKLWDSDEIYSAVKLLSKVADFMVFTLQKHIIFIMLDVGYESAAIEDVMDYKLDSISSILNIDIRNMLHDDKKYQGLILNYGLIDAIEKKFKGIL